MDQVTIDFRISTAFPNATVGQKYIVNCEEVTYTGSDRVSDMIDDLSMKHPELIHTENAAAMLRDPMGFKPPTFQLDPNITKQLVSIAGAAAGNAAAGAALGALTGLAKNFMPPGMDGPVEALKGAMKGVTAGIPGLPGGAGGKASDIAKSLGDVTALKSHLTSQIKGPASALFSSVKGNFLSDIPGADALKNTVNLQSEISKLGGLAGNPVAFAAHAAKLHQQFPMIDVNKIAGNMLKGALSGKGFNIKTMIPNMNLAGGLTKMLPIPGKTPVLDAMKPQKTAKPAKPVKALQMKNLFAEAAAGGALATLTQPLSAFMGMMSTIAPQTNLISAGPAKTSYGPQKLTSMANTINWGSGGYGRNTDQADLELKRLELSSKISMHMAELEQMTDYSKLTSMNYADLMKKHPEINSKTTVAEALHIIDMAERVAAAVAESNPIVCADTSVRPV